MKIAGIQFACVKDKEKNVEKGLKMADMAIEAGAQIICFQELFNLHWFPNGRDEKAFAAADTVSSPVIELMRKKAADAGAAVILPIFEREDARYFNSAVVIDADGAVCGTYRKVHVPDIPLWEEKFYFSTGDRGLPVFETKYGRIGVQISWDNLFPEGTRILALKGTDIVFAPTACAFKSQHIWQTVITANAITNSIFVMRVNRVGSEDTQDFYGMSFCVNPEGELLGGPTGRQDGILLADVNLETLREVRREWPILKERRPDFYSEILMPT
ncbi:MAG TPA: nitrilase-related carbon-nitrogen hydrolase [Syntrophorhabdales bacterium]|nr:nitrilase-related carbon-nitrogen hydrolase [Syntrophorhabdales bacterium]